MKRRRDNEKKEMEMRDFSTIQKLVGAEVTVEQLTKVDCYVQEKLGLFIPSLGECGYAAQPNHAHPSYMVVIRFPETQQKVNHYPAEIWSPDVPHSDNDNLHYYCLLVKRDFFESQWKLYDAPLPHFEKYQFQICSDVLKAMNMFAFEYSKQMPNADITLGAQAMILVHWLIRSLLGETIDLRAISSDYSVARAQHFMENHFDEKITAQELANLGYTSVSSLNRRFKAEIGMTPMQYLLKIRMTRAKTLLQRGNIPVTNIAMRCGFSSSSHFCTAFLKQTGITPSDYQAKYVD